MSATPDLIFQTDNPDADDMAALIAAHHAQMRAQSPPESCHVKTSDELEDAGAQTFSLRDAATQDVLAVGAMVEIEPGHFELKSMHVRASARGRGLGKVLLGHMVSAAQSSGATHLWLETGSSEDYTAARALYSAAGFKICPPFGTYVADPLSAFMTRAL